MSSAAYSWLPDRHLGIAATLAHSDELVGQISDLLFPYQTQPEGIIGLREERHHSMNRTVVSRLAPLPPKIPLLVADTLVTLRAAIEHALFTEVEHLDGPLEEKAAKLVEMPAAETYRAFDDWVKNRRKNGPPSLRVGSEIIRRIAALQPLHRTQNPQAHPLARLASYTNHAKHRTPSVVAVRLAAMYEDAKAPRSIAELESGPMKPLRLGDVIAETVPGVYVPITLFPTIGINLPLTDEWPVLLSELNEIATWVRTQAVPRIITGGQPPQPALPARYSISIANPDERLAMAAGTTTSAAARHAGRLTAAAGRPDLVGLLKTINGAPEVEVLADWLDGLSDDAVNERLGRLGTITAAASKPQQAIAALLQLRNEAVDFALHRRTHPS